MALDLTMTVQNNRKALVMSDTTPSYTPGGVPIGWGTDFDFADYIIAGTQNASMSIIVYKYDGTSETITVDLTAEGFFEGITDQGDLSYNLVSIDGVMQVIQISAFDTDTAEVLPDGIYDITYTLTTTGSDVVFTEKFLFDDNAEAILVDKALNLDTKILSSNNTDLVQLLDINVLEAMMFIITNGDLTSDQDAILNMLRVINNEEYEYYMD